jgi:hypothetical protein
MLSYVCHAGLASGGQQGKTGRTALSSLSATGPGELEFGSEPNERLLSLACITLS